jgi:RHS repeat-associated protein
VDALNNRTTYTYNVMNRLTQIVQPGNLTTTFTYDTRGRRTSDTDANSKVTSYGYDDADRLLSVTDANSGLTAYGYDTENHLAAITDAMGRVTGFGYDSLGRVTSVTFPSQLSESYTYDDVGNLLSKTDRKGQTISYAYDALDRLTSKEYPDSSAVDYVYDNLSRLTQATDATGTYGFSYDNLGRLTGTATTYSFLSGRTLTNSYTYDAASNRVSMTDPEGGITSYAYDNLNRLTGLTDFNSNAFGFGYDSLGRRTSLTRPNGVNTGYTYDSLSRLLSEIHAMGGITRDGATYTYDNVGNRTSKTFVQQSDPDPISVLASYSYDNIYQLTQTLLNGGLGESFGYDAVGNRQSSLGVSPYLYNNSNELTSTPLAGFNYDENGNTTSKTDGNGTTNYAWDYENRLVSVSTPSSGTVSFAYDPFGRRILKSLATGTTIYAYDGDSVAEELDSGGNPAARYAQGLGIDEPLAMYRGGAASYYQADGLGSVTSLTDGAGGVAASYVYDSFGNLSSSTGTLTNTFRYTGREFDSETGLYYYRARYYDSAVGRFLNQDPIKFRGGMNFYAYVGNTPVNTNDSSGLWTRDAHRQIIWNALHPCHVSNVSIWQIQQGSDFVDGYFQAPQYSYMHYMTDGTVNQSPGDAMNSTNDFVQRQMGVAAAYLAAGGTSSSMFVFGMAMHPHMDMSSPAHHDGSGLPRPWCGFTLGCSNLLEHALLEDVDMLNAHPEVQEQENTIIRSWYELLTGKTLDCGCRRETR